MLANLLMADGDSNFTEAAIRRVGSDIEGAGHVRKMGLKKLAKYCFPHKV